MEEDDMREAVYSMLLRKLDQKNKKSFALLKLFVHNPAQLQAFIQRGPTSEQLESVVQLKTPAVSQALRTFSPEEDPEKIKAQIKRDMKILHHELGKLFRDIPAQKSNFSNLLSEPEAEESQVDTNEERSTKRKPGL